MFTEFHSLEESLKSFLIEEQTDRYNTYNANLHKYNNLKIYMDPHKNETPHLIIRIGISEAMYNIENGEKIFGGLGSDERVVRRWIGRNLSRLNLNSAWARTNKTKQVTKSEGTDA